MEDMLMICAVAAGDCLQKPASKIIYVDLWADDVTIEEPVMQVPLPYRRWWEVPANYSDIWDVEREHPLQLEFQLL